MTIRIGMLWRLDSKKPLEQSVQEALAYYQDKYGKIPHTLIVHPDSPLAQSGFHQLNVITDGKLFSGECLISHQISE